MWLRISIQHEMIFVILDREPCTGRSICRDPVELCKSHDCVHISQTAMLGMTR